jgi:hypothetical protein
MDRREALVGIPVHYHPAVPQFIRDRVEVFVVAVSWGHMFFDFADLLRMNATANHVSMAVTLALEAIEMADQQAV